MEVIMWVTVEVEM